MAGPDDLAALASGRKKRAEARVAARRLIREHGLPMKIVGVDHVLADNRTMIYFSAPHRVDFRSLVRDLGATLRGRVELRQLSARDEARVIGGIGSCGRDLCCSTFLVDFEPVSVRMAKDQDLPLNPLRISGACGRLMCCLKYEHPLYQDFAGRAPEVGSCGPPRTARAPWSATRCRPIGGAADERRRPPDHLRAGLGVHLAQGARPVLRRRHGGLGAGQPVRQRFGRQLAAGQSGVRRFAAGSSPPGAAAEHPTP